MTIDQCWRKVCDRCGYEKVEPASPNYMPWRSAPAWLGVKANAVMCDTCRDEFDTLYQRFQVQAVGWWKHGVALREKKA